MYFFKNCSYMTNVIKKLVNEFAICLHTYQWIPFDRIALNNVLYQIKG